MTQKNNTYQALDEFTCINFVPKCQNTQFLIPSETNATLAVLLMPKFMTTWTVDAYINADCMCVHRHAV